MKRIKEGLDILSKYNEDGDFAAEHDQIFVGDNAEDMKISKDDLKELDKLGWFIDEEFDCWSHFC